MYGVETDSMIKQTICQIRRQGLNCSDGGDVEHFFVSGEEVPGDDLLSLGEHYTHVRAWSLDSSWTEEIGEMVFLMYLPP